MTIEQILIQASLVDANQFAKFLDDNKVNWTILEANVMNYNDDYFIITLDDFEDENILFYDGVFQD
jgi:hypothetical protein